MLRRGDMPVKLGVCVSSVCYKCVAVCYKCVAVCYKCVAVPLLLNVVLWRYTRQARCVRECSVLKCDAIPLLLNVVSWRYGVATISRLLKITGLFCKRAL